MPIFKTATQDAKLYKGKWRVTNKLGDAVGTVVVVGKKVRFLADGRYERLALRLTVHRKCNRTMKLTFATYNPSQHKYWLPQLQDDGSIHWLGQYHDTSYCCDDPDPEWMHEDLDVNKWLVWTRAAKEVVVVDAFPLVHEAGPSPCYGIASTALPQLR